MTETPTSLTEAAPAPDLSHDPGDILLRLIVSLLAPMFLDASGGNLHLARMAAVETITAHRARDDAQLLAIAQVIACGLAALGSLSLSMADGVSLSMALRLRGNANALARTAERHRRAIGDSQPGPAVARQHPAPDAATPADTATPADAAYEAAVLAGVEQTQRRVAQVRAGQRVTPTATTAPASNLGPSAAPIHAPIDRQRQAMWGAAMSDIATEYAASLPSLPPAQRKAASMRAAALSSTANELIFGAARPQPKAA